MQTTSVSFTVPVEMDCGHGSREGRIYDAPATKYRQVTLCMKCHEKIVRYDNYVGYDYAVTNMKD